MATKKDQQPDAAFGKTPEVEQPEAVPERLQPIEVKPEVVKVSGYRELSEDEIRRTNQIKSNFDAIIGYLRTLRDSVHDAESQRMYSVAITEAETASMWAVRAVTHRG